MEEIVIYEKPTCSKCRAAVQIVDQTGVPYRTIRYHDAPLTKAKLAELSQKIGIAPKELLRTEDPLFRSLQLSLDALSDADALDLMIEHPDLMQRPILERGALAIIGRPAERVHEFLHA